MTCNIDPRPIWNRKVGLCRSFKVLHSFQTLATRVIQFATNAGAFKSLTEFAAIVTAISDAIVSNSCNGLNQDK